MKYHFEPAIGWMNDPNGLIYYNNRYHAFFQHNPHDIKWGPMHWGHATSEDLINWKEHEIALFPNMEYEDDGGCFSGSAIEKDGKLYLIYTSVSKKYGQSQSVAWSEDGIHFTKYEGNPVIAHFPEDATADFRDPKVFEYGDEYRMIVGTKFNERGRIVQYSSKDLLNWNYLGVLYEDADYNNVIECPDMFMLNGKWILMYSVIGKKNSREQFVIGDFDGTHFTAESMCTPEFGPQFYAAQTFMAQDRRILIGWLYDWDIKGDSNAKSAGALTIPREVSIANGKLRLYPVAEAKDLLKDISEGYEIPGLSVTVKSRDKGFVIDSPVLNEKIIYSKPFTKLELLTDGSSAEIFVDGGVMNYSLNYCGLV